MPSPWVAEAPARVDASKRFVFYLHGHIIEQQQDRRPRHPSFGDYDYDGVLRALGAPDTVVISALRPRGSRPVRYAEMIASQVRHLLSAGVPPSHIAVVGFSRGGWIAQLVAAEIEAPIRVALLAWCPGPRQALRAVHGAVLSIRERSDRTISSCTALFKHSTGAVSTRQIVVDAGGSHGAFYKPKAQWLQPLVDFIRQ